MQTVQVELQHNTTHMLVWMPRNLNPKAGQKWRDAFGQVWAAVIVYTYCRELKGQDVKPGGWERVE